MVGESETPSSTSNATIAPIDYTITQRRLHVVIAGLWLSLFLSALDTTIVTTSLISISSDFNALGQSAWLITAYLLTYNAFLLITAKFSDVWGLKAVLLTCNIVFLVFSMACAGSRTMVQLITFRAFQGIGGSGLYSLVFVAIMKLVTPEKMGFYSGIVSSVFALANLLGPILGGLISDHTTWRWIFWMNGPTVAAAIVLLFFAMPSLKEDKSNSERRRNFDVVGGVLSVCWSIPLLFALQEGGLHYEWNSAVIIGTLVCGLMGLLLFGVYEGWITYRTHKEAVFPFRFLTRPEMALLLLSMFLLGMPFMVAIVQLPQRFQAVNNASASRSGIQLLPVTLMTPVGAMLAGLVMGKKIAAEYVLIATTGIVSVGIGLLSSLPVDASFWSGTYGYEIITGLGLGLASPAYYFLLYTSVDEKDAAVGTGALNMVRTLGGGVAVAICSALHHSTLQSKLSRFLAPEQIKLVEESSAYVAQLPLAAQKKVGEVFGQSYNRQFSVMLAFTCSNFLVAIVLAVVRRRRGIFGLVPVRKEENEFMKKQPPSGAADSKAEVTKTPTLGAQQRPVN
ncbi:MFS general substrate transporter [Lophiostoma macrostomum CBS 122681]|uniref:MFS general substrate transporter n=1 Tax=Lophiostoma macrostomum CBS 122681 TaxID=1314788 RepID=A0A6A6T6S2_9PLEO|nr:MFS general substrate transporter [Lophiostoma macrostomum CBS 122681]